jgi:uncharacterized phage-associated protein
MNINQQEGCAYLPAHIANYFLWIAEKENIKDITPMKLIKLVYFGYAWYYAVFNRKLFTEKVEAWRYGPVIPSIYHEFKRFGSLPISNYAIDFSLETEELSYPIVKSSDDKTLRTLNAVWNVYKDKNGAELSAITHEENSPWCHAYEQGENTPMDDNKIIERARTAILKYKVS